MYCRSQDKTRENFHCFSMVPCIRFFKKWTFASSFRLKFQFLLFVVFLTLSPRTCAECRNKCNGHGTCIDDVVCLCKEGYFGAECSGSLDVWKKMHKLEHNFYEHSSFKSRYVIAAHYLRKCTHIVEVGGYRTPITGFLKSQNHKSVTVLDPYIKPLAEDTLNGAPCKVRHLPMLFEDYKLRGDEDCFVYMGLDYYNTANEPMCVNQTGRTSPTYGLPCSALPSPIPCPALRCAPL